MLSSAICGVVPASLERSLELGGPNPERQGTLGYSAATSEICRQLEEDFAKRYVSPQSFALIVAHRP